MTGRKCLDSDVNNQNLFGFAPAAVLQGISGPISSSFEKVRTTLISCMPQIQKTAGSLPQRTSSERGVWGGCVSVGRSEKTQRVR